MAASASLRRALYPRYVFWIITAAAFGDTGSVSAAMIHLLKLRFLTGCPGNCHSDLLIVQVMEHTILFQLCSVLGHESYNLFVNMNSQSLFLFRRNEARKVATNRMTSNNRESAQGSRWTVQLLVHQLQPSVKDGLNIAGGKEEDDLIQRVQEEHALAPSSLQTKWTTITELIQHVKFGNPCLLTRDVVKLLEFDLFRPLEQVG